ncbi:MAG: TetR/AcrR family transcriptional regulator, partial [Candidatus Methylomirabilis sp.]|nr:TetR/AcrR family transcriptional regulator [Deltaproteobacteria bacterium]
PRDEAAGERRREEILAAAARVFADRGFPGTDVGEIAEGAGVAKGTVYRYFESKQALFLAAVDRGLRLLRAELDAIAGDERVDLLARATQGVRAYFGFFDEHPEFVELLILERAEFKDRVKPTYFEHRDAALGPWKALLRRLIAAGVIRAVDVDRAADLMTNLLYGTLFTNHFNGRRLPLEEETQGLIDFCLNGLLAPGAKASTQKE